MAFSTFPVEILAHVFIIGQRMAHYDSQDPYDDEPAPTHPFELLVSAVNNYWRHVALGTALLWCHIESRSPRDKIAAYLARSESAELHVRLSESEDPETLALIMPTSARWATVSVNALLDNIQGALFNSLRHITTCAQLRRVCTIVEAIEGAETPALGDKAPPQIFVDPACAPAFVRLRGFALLVCRPSLVGVVTLHLDLTRRIRFSYALLRSLLTCSPALTHLSIYGYLEPNQWPPVLTVGRIPLPALRSLRLKCVLGHSYSELLTRIEAQGLVALALKDVHNDDLDALWPANAVAPVFPKLERFACVGNEFSDALYPLFMAAFPTVRDFAYIGEAAGCPHLLRHLRPQRGNWPDLLRVTFLFDEDDSAYTMIDELADWRELQHRRNLTLRLGTTMDISEFQSYASEAGIAVEKMVRLDPWPTEGQSDDEEDTLFT
ncbi:hypothetical protein BD626DRAFT_252406 [Schizophyllum amplum]|uniref:F-box domain-containing protein n=1 Tax=Schizophyllum amplum TaxID=97359 RepID=A0A550CI00_9AGAR|nr:hypothetical protein BD626DRAFT_252406 [Auriculariopsis ampla]